MTEMIRDLLKRYGEILRYLIVGVMTTVVSLGIYYGLVLTVLDPEKALQLQAANILSWIGAVAFAYVTNRVYVFRSENQNRFTELMRFVSARLATLFMDMAAMFLMVTALGVNDKLAKLITQVIVLVGNYLLSKLFVFAGK